MPPAGKLQHQKQGSGGQQDAAGKGLEGELLVEEDKGQNQGNYHAQLVHRHNLRHLAQLQGPVVAQPGRACGQTGQNQKQPAPEAHPGQRGLLPGEKHQPMASTTAVRMPVARLEGTPWIPAFARIEVRAANRADSRANTNHVPNAVTSG